MSERGQSEEKLTVLVAVDGSRFSQHALEWYIRVLYKPNFDLLLVHCMEPLSCISESTTPEEYEKMLADGKETAKKVEDRFEQFLRENNVNGRTTTIFGHRPGEILIDTAKKENAAMIVVGSRGLSQVRKTLLGSVSDYLVHHAYCPVIVCRDPNIDNKLNIM
ncbi:hypothetical protein LSH36_455g07071 [Paralvinella palmiformis]|uniref:UspA domain-containing protein n=1 Tax=Paralvinella palmiformis TaxID=53620 RepID=A0AAD9JA70_9ANNE|nr:hypothetical protein LSH36_455g07071 [Paralvinella palmiformis]